MLRPSALLDPGKPIHGPAAIRSDTLLAEPVRASTPVEPLLPGRLHRVHVRALTRTGTGDWSAPVVFLALQIGESVERRRSMTCEAGIDKKRAVVMELRDVVGKSIVPVGKSIVPVSVLQDALSK